MGIPEKIPYRLIIVSIAITAFIYLTIIFFADYKKIVSVITSLSLSTYIILVLISIASYLMRFGRWLQYFSIKKDAVPFFQQLFIYLSGFALTTTPGKSGELVRSVFLKKYGIGYHFSTAAFFSERLMDLISVASLALFALWALPLEFIPFLILAIFILVLLAFFRSQCVDRFLEYFAKNKLMNFTEYFKQDVSHNFQWRMLVKTTPMSFIAWFLQGISLWFICHEMGYSMAFFTIVGVYCFSIIAGAISMIPGGIGVTEASIVGLLMFLGMDISSATTAALLNRVVTLWLAISIGIIALLVLGAKQKA